MTKRVGHIIVLDLDSNPDIVGASLLFYSPVIHSCTTEGAIHCFGSKLGGGRVVFPPTLLHEVLSAFHEPNKHLNKTEPAISGSNGRRALHALSFSIPAFGIENSSFLLDDTDGFSVFVLVKSAITGPRKHQNLH